MTKQEAAESLMRRRQNDFEIIDSIYRDGNSKELADFIEFLRKEIQVNDMAIAALLEDEMILRPSYSNSYSNPSN